ncbi:MAG: diaminopimelate epimerase, partial [Clostridia bacterium]|nr:diaminopimelate epimerase [Clostridia bacterium]
TFYENGSGYTLSCGSGTVAFAYALRLKNPTLRKETEVFSKGGMQTVTFDGDGITVKSKVVEIYKGEI